MEKLHMNYRSALVLLPHYDDEVFTLPILQSPNFFVNKLNFIFLTDSQGVNQEFNSLQRKIESEKFIKRICGEIEYNIYDFGLFLKIKDGELHQNLEKVEKKIKSLLLKTNSDIILSPAYEGGHQDHDSAAVINFKLSALPGCDNWFFPTYRAAKLKPFFAVMNLRESHDSHVIKKVCHFNQNLIVIPFIFKSQWKSWIGLFPLMVLKAILHKHVKILANPEKIDTRLKTYFYEHRKRIKQMEVILELDNYIKRSINEQTP